MGFYVYSDWVKESGCMACLVRADYNPRKVNFGSMLAEKGIGSGEIPAEPTGLDGAAKLPLEQKEALRERLNHGGKITLQAWDDFLADLVELGILSESDRWFANHSYTIVPGEGTEEFDSLWQGDPIQWMRSVDRFNIQHCTDMEPLDPSGIDRQREVNRNVTRIVKEILRGADPGKIRALPVEESGSAERAAGKKALSAQSVGRIQEAAARAAQELSRKPASDLTTDELLALLRCCG